MRFASSQTKAIALRIALALAAFASFDAAYWLIQDKGLSILVVPIVFVGTGFSCALLGFESLGECLFGAGFAVFFGYTVLKGLLEGFVWIGSRNGPIVVSGRPTHLDRTREA
jgi:hypothetical protein